MGNGWDMNLQEWESHLFGFLNLGIWRFSLIFIDMIGGGM
jgi:hypothetical protein